LRHGDDFLSTFFPLSLMEAFFPLVAQTKESLPVQRRISLASGTGTIEARTKVQRIPPITHTQTVLKYLALLKVELLRSPKADLTLSELSSLIPTSNSDPQQRDLSHHRHFSLKVKGRSDNNATQSSYRRLISSSCWNGILERVY
jgi:hypothetical protein